MNYKNPQLLFQNVIDRSLFAAVHDIFSLLSKCAALNPDGSEDGEKLSGII